MGRIHVFAGLAFLLLSALVLIVVGGVVYFINKPPTSPVPATNPDEAAKANQTGVILFVVGLAVFTIATILIYVALPDNNSVTSSSSSSLTVRDDKVVNERLAELYHIEQTALAGRHSDSSRYREIIGELQKWYDTNRNSSQTAIAQHVKAVLDPDRIRKIYSDLELNKRNLDPVAKMKVDLVKNNAPVYDNYNERYYTRRNEGYNVDQYRPRQPQDNWQSSQLPTMYPGRIPYGGEVRLR